MDTRDAFLDIYPLHEGGILTLFLSKQVAQLAVLYQYQYENI
jgi:hypothetical protein